jgi:RNA polymerase sigma-70 factor (ECF subfamily)
MAVARSNQEAQWVVRAQCDDRDALERLLRSLQPSLYRYVRGLIGYAQADDVVQDVLIAVARKLTWLGEPTLVRPWAFRIASRAAFRHLRRERRLTGYGGDEDALDALTAPEPPGDDLLRELLASSLLSPASRAVLVLHFQEEMPLAEVAAVLEIPLGTAKSRLAYGLRALRRHLAEKRSL